MASLLRETRLVSLIASLFVALALFSKVSVAEIEDFGFDSDEVGLTDLMDRQSPGGGRVFGIVGQNDVGDGALPPIRPTFVPKRYGINKHQAFRFGKRLDTGLMLADGDNTISSLVGGGDQGGAGAVSDPNLNKYLNKFLEKHKTSGIFRWGRK